MSDTLRAAVVQLSSGNDPERNLAAAELWIGRAADAGANLVATPENTDFLGSHRRKVERAESVDGPLIRRYAESARRHRIHLLVGSFAERDPRDPGAGPPRCFNTSVLLGPDGQVVATYRKIHLFDVDLPPDVVFRESDTVRAGADVVVARAGTARIGLSVCYDLRFPELYRRAVAAGAEVLAVPSAFTRRTGRDHWEILLRARAIENQCWVVAPAQEGRHDDRGLRESWGHSMIVDPWGRIVAEVEGPGPGMAVADLDLRELREVRRRLPALEHRRI